ncbi:1-acyl-sn-glycerol-3-phosphate acyltransferase [Synergistales bacterium]|nr:1-acyl-sn-glycerol-3-phosphate acyltransferase [Synergistales bacterium]
MFYMLARIALRIYFAVYHRVTINGLAELREFLSSYAAPVIVAANHESYLDPPLVGMAFPSRLRFVAWDGLFKVPVFASLIRALGAVPVSQQDKSSAAALLRQVIGFIEDGSNVLIFPEGERSPDGNMLPLQGGAALIAAKTGAPIIPVWIEGTYEAYSMYVLLPRPRKVTLTFGKPIMPDSGGETSEKERRNALLGRLRTAMEEMGEVYPA